MQSLSTAENPQLWHHRSPSPGWGPATSSRSHKTRTLPFHGITAAKDDQQTQGRAGGHRKEVWWTLYLTLTLWGWWLSCRETNNLFCLTTIKRICPAHYAKESFQYLFKMYTIFLNLTQQHFLSTAINTLTKTAQHFPSGVAVPAFPQSLCERLQDCSRTRAGTAIHGFACSTRPHFSSQRDCPLEERNRAVQNWEIANMGLVALAGFAKECRGFTYIELWHDKCCVLLYLNSF